jgi:uncharacterized phage infection (PIP) family protein YhgE
MEAAPVSSENSTVTNESEQALQATQESLDKVRDILFGTQLRQQDCRFSQLEEKVNSQWAVFREETKKSLEALTDFVKSEINAATSALAAESAQRHETFNRLQDELRNADRGLSDRLDQASRALGDESKAGLQQLSAELQNKAGALEARIAAADGQHQAAASELRTQLLDTTNRLRDESQQTRSELHALVEKLVSELRSAKTDRTALATLFSEMAGRLS